MITSNTKSTITGASLPIKSSNMRSFAAGLDFVYVTPRMCVCRTPQTEIEAERLSAHFQSQHPHSHKVMDCSAYPVNKREAKPADAASSGNGTRSVNQYIIPSGENEVEEINASPSQLTSSRYFESTENYRGPISLKQLMHCMNRYVLRRAGRC